jgi:hypothetical protein
MSSSKQLRRLTLMGIGLMIMGAAVSLVGALFVHFVGSPETNNLGEEIFSAFPRHFLLELFFQIVSLTGVFIFLAGMVVGFVYKREMTWARATIGAFVFTAVSMILLGVVPDEWLTLARANLQWDGGAFVSFVGCVPDQGLPCIELPSALIGGNELEVTWETLKDALSFGYANAVIGGIAFVMIRAQKWAKEQRDAPPPEPISEYGRPLRIAEES